MATTKTNPQNDDYDMDDLDALFVHETSLEEMFNGSNKQQHDTTNDRLPGHRDGTPAGSDLGIDEEVQQQAKRRKIAKLDEARLNSAAGIPKLQKIAKTRLKFRGKGHEFSDVAILLRTYQLWLDDLYPRAKFTDGLAILEKLGHTKNVQRLRSGWIDENRRRDAMDDNLDPDAQSATNNPGLRRTAADDEPGEARLGPDVNFGLGNSTARNFSSEEQTSTGNRDSGQEAQAPEDDEVDQLLAEQENLTLRAPQPGSNRNSSNSYAGLNAAKPRDSEDDAFADEEDVMREFGW